MSSTDRNAPCPCGSGRKYKHCHGGPHATPRAAFLSGDRQSATDRLIRFVDRSEFHRDHDIAAEIFWVDTDPDTLSDELFAQSSVAYYEWFAADLDLDDGITPLMIFLQRHGDDLSPGELEYLRRVSAARLRLYEIRDVRPEAGFELADLRTDEIISVVERTATRQLVRWDILAARVMPGPDGALIIESAPYAFPAASKSALLRELGRCRKAFAKAQPKADETVFEQRVAPILHQLWLMHVALRPLPTVVTKDGEPLADTKVSFEITDPDRVRSALAGQGDFEEGPNGDFVWLDRSGPAGAKRSGTGSSILGVIEVAGRRLTLGTFSEARAARGRALLETILGDTIRHRGTTVSDPMSAVAREVPKPSARTGKRRSDISPEEKAGIVLQALDQHYRAWIDEPLPALGGRSPRHAARLKTGRPKVVALIKTLESAAERDRRDGRPAYDVAWMWEELGLER